MPIAAGKYNVQFRWMRQQAAVDPDYGQPAQSWTPFLIVWGYLTESFAFNEKGSEARATIHLRGLLQLDPGDRLEEVQRGSIVNGQWTSYRWTITGTRQDVVNDELLVEAFR